MENRIKVSKKGYSDREHHAVSETFHDFGGY